MKKISIFYGGGTPHKTGTEKNTDSAPLSGDALDDKIVQLYAAASEEGYSQQEIQKRLHEELEVATVTLTKSQIFVEGHPLERVTPSSRALYILVARHPEGVKKEKNPEGLPKDSFYKYLDEYKSILQELMRKREERQFFDASYEKRLCNKGNIDKCFDNYRGKLEEAITKVENSHKNLNLSSCKISGKKCWRITARVIDNVNIHSVPEQ